IEQKGGIRSEGGDDDLRIEPRHESNVPRGPVRRLFFRTARDQPVAIRRLVKSRLLPHLLLHRKAHLLQHLASPRSLAPRALSGQAASRAAPQDSRPPAPAAAPPWGQRDTAGAWHQSPPPRAAATLARARHGLWRRRAGRPP